MTLAITLSELEPTLRQRFRDSVPNDVAPRHTADVTDVIAVLLAAGAGSRFAGSEHKLLATLPAADDRPAEAVAARAFSNLARSGIEHVVVVTGAVDVGAVLPITDAANATVEIVHNPRWATGQMSSVRAGISRARDLGARRVVIGLADQPAVEPAAWNAVAGSGGAIVVATYDGRRGNPVALAAEVWSLLPEEGDEGARTLMRLHPELVVEVACSGSPDDIDTTEDLRRWQNNSSTNSP